MFTEMQIDSLKYLILKTDRTDLAKQMMIFLINQSLGLTKDVCFTLIAGREGYTAEEIDEARRIGTDHLFHILRSTGSTLMFTSHYGDFDPARGGDPMNCDGMFAGAEGVVSNPDPAMFKKGMPMRYTFWLAKDGYSRKAELIVTSREEIEKNLK